MRHPFSVLVVDDDAMARYEVTAVLERRDYSIGITSTIQEAADRLTSGTVDLLVTGARIGSASGLQFVAACRARHPGLAAIVVAPPGAPVPEMDAWRYGATAVSRPLDPAEFLMIVAERLAAVRRRQRWPRKPVTDAVALSVSGSPARLVDVSYGGLRFEIERESYELRSPMQIDLPRARLRVQADLVWSAGAPDGHSCLCGAALTNTTPPPRWRDFVDRVA